MADGGDGRTDQHILHELGFELRRAGDGFRGSARVVPEMWVPGTTNIRTSILATWTDVAAGHLALDALVPRVPVTLELEVQVYSHQREDTGLYAVARSVKAGRSVVVGTVEFTDDDGDPVALGTASFMAAPDPLLTFPAESIDPATRPTTTTRLQVPFAERAGCERPQAGVAVLHVSDDGRNASNTMNGGLIALAVEEAALSLTPRTTLCSIGMRFLRPVRTGPAIASAQVRAGVARVEVRDAGDDDRVAVVATTRTFGSSNHRAA